MGAVRRGARATALATVAIAVAAAVPIVPADAKKPDRVRGAGKGAQKHDGAKQGGRGHERKVGRGHALSGHVAKRDNHAERRADKAQQRAEKAAKRAEKAVERAEKKTPGRAGKDVERRPDRPAPSPGRTDKPARDDGDRDRRARVRRAPAAPRSADDAAPDRSSVRAAGRPRTDTRRGELERPAADAAASAGGSTAGSAQAAREAAAARARAQARARERARDAASDRRERPPVYRVLAPQVVERIVKVVPASMRWLVAGLATIVVVLLFGALLVAARGRRTERHRARLVEEVGLLQRTLLPDVPERIGGLRATVAYRPADGPGAGGDFYDVFRLGDGRVGIVLGDVSGHGREVLGRTASLRYTLRAYLEAGLTPRSALRVAGEVLDRDFDAGFATVVLAVHDAAAGTLTYASAGHPPPLAAGPAAHEPVTAAAAPPVGAGLPTGQRQTVIGFGRGARACFFTDGLVEARGPDGMLGRDGVARVVTGLGDDAAADRVLAAVRRAAPEGGDDMAVCLVRAERGAAPAGGERVEELALARAELATATLQRFLWACGVPGDDAGELILEAQRVADTAETVVVRVRFDGAGAAPVVEVGDEAASSLPALAARRL